MVAAHETERSPLLPSSSSLNPRAASFNFTPKDRLQAAPLPQPQPQAQTATPRGTSKEDATTGSTSISYAAAAAAPPPARTSNQVQNAIHEHPASGANGSAVSAAGTGQPKQPSHSHSSSLSTSPQSILHHSLPSASPIAPLSRPRTRTSSISSHSSGCSSASSSSCYSLPPLSTFTHSHLLQFFLSTLLCLLLLAALVWWKHEIRYSELLLGSAAWLAGEGAKETVFDISGPRNLELPASSGSGEEEGSPSPSRKRKSAWAGRGLGVPTVVHALLQEALRLGAIICMVALLPSDQPTLTTTGIPPPRPPTRGPRAPLPPLDILFFSALWMALGWATVEIVWGNRDFWRRMKLYDEVLAGEVVLEDGEEGFHSEGEHDDDDEEEDLTANGYSYGGTNSNGTPEFLSSSAFDRVIEGRAETPAELAREMQVEEEMEARVRECERDEIEAQLGVPLYEIPVAVVFVWRLDSILLSLVLTLLLSLPFRTTSPSLIAFPLWPTFAACAVLHSLLSLLWCLRIKYVGIPSISYATLVVLVFLLFAVLAAWGALE